MKVIATIICGCLFLTACASKKVDVGPYPTEERDFTLPPAQLAEQYPSVEKRHTQLIRPNYTAISYDELRAAWGEPVTSNKHLWRATPVLASLVFVLAISRGEFDPGVHGAILGSGIAVDYFFGQRMSEWEKGDYRIAAITTNMPFMQDRILGWNWHYKNEAQNIATHAYERERSRRQVFFEFNYHAGGEFIDLPHEHFTDRYGNGGALVLGYLVPVPNSLWELDISAAWDGTSAWTSDFNYSTGRIYIDALAMRLSPSKTLRLGAGPTYTTRSSYRYEDTNVDREMRNHDAFGLAGRVEYRMSASTGFGLRAEALALKDENGETHRADNVGIYVRTYF